MNDRFQEGSAPIRKAVKGRIRLNATRSRQQGQHLCRAAALRKQAIESATVFRQRPAALRWDAPLPLPGGRTAWAFAAKAARAGGASDGSFQGGIPRISSGRQACGNLTISKTAFLRRSLAAEQDQT